MSALHILFKLWYRKSLKEAFNYWKSEYFTTFREYYPHKYNIFNIYPETFSLHFNHFFSIVMPFLSSIEDLEYWNKSNAKQ